MFGFDPIRPFQLVACSMTDMTAGLLEVAKQFQVETASLDLRIAARRGFQPTLAAGAKALALALECYLLCRLKIQYVGNCWNLLTCSDFSLNILTCLSNLKWAHSIGGHNMPRPGCGALVDQHQERTTKEEREEAAEIRWASLNVAKCQVSDAWNQFMIMFFTVPGFHKT